MALSAVERLRALIERLASRFPSLTLSIDLSELRGFSYHTGVGFAAYHNGSGRLMARGGRYDNVGELFGRARPATGFDIELSSLLDQLPSTGRERQIRSLSLTPWSSQPSDRGGPVGEGSSASQRRVPRNRGRVGGQRSAEAITVRRLTVGATRPLRKGDHMVRNIAVIGTHWGDEGKGKSLIF